MRITTRFVIWKRCLFALLLISGVYHPFSAVAQNSKDISQSQPAPPGARSNAALGFDRARYNPAILRLSFSKAPNEPASASASASQATLDFAKDSSRKPDAFRSDASFLDLVLILPAGDLVGKRVDVSTRLFTSLLRNFYAELSRQASLDVANPQAPSRQLYQLLIAPIEPDLKAAGVTTLLISLDSGLQAIPISALHDGVDYFGVKYAYSLTPSLGLMPLAPSAQPQKGKYLLAGSSKFSGLSPLPLVPQEVTQIGNSVSSDTYLDASFTPTVLLQGPAQSSVSRVHVATHAEFLPGGPQRALVYSGTAPVPLSQFSALRQRRQSDPMDLFVLSACRTAIGDADTELGFSGLALQAGSRSAIGSLWYVDDVATSAFFVQFYSFLRQGLPKAEALQSTRKAFVDGRVRPEADRILGVDSQVLLSGLTTAQQRRVAAGLTNPYFWAGIQLLGAPW